MSLITTVIINEVTNLSDARYCAGMGVDYIGFRIDEDHNKYVDLANYNEITNWVAGIDFVGESSGVVDQNTIQYNIDQLLLDDIKLLPLYTGQQAFWSISIDDVDDHRSILATHMSKIKGVILTNHDDVITEAHKIQIKRLSEDFDIYVAFGITGGNVLALINELPIKGLSLRGSEEIRSGYKDYDELADILELLEKED